MKTLLIFIFAALAIVAAMGPVIKKDKIPTLSVLADPPAEFPCRAAPSPTFLGYYGMQQQQQLSAGNYQFSEGCSLANATPFYRQYARSCQECVSMCQMSSYGPAPFCCRSGVYDSNAQMCELFNVKAGDSPSCSLIPCPGRTYFTQSSSSWGKKK
uniref:Uncharacterized protein n=1 Tax=Romanomermis culicivorax TaxID=13658 RepID=A0A915K9D7_ROMCU